MMERGRKTTHSLHDDLSLPSVDGMVRRQAGHSIARPLRLKTRTVKTTQAWAHALVAAQTHADSGPRQ